MRKTFRTRVFMWLYHHAPRLDQWFLNQCDEYPCDDCIHFDSYGCEWLFVDSECNYVKISDVNEDERESDRRRDSFGIEEFVSRHDQA